MTWTSEKSAICTRQTTDEQPPQWAVEASDHHMPI